MPNTDTYQEMDPSANAHIVQDALEGYNQQYDMPENEYKEAVARHENQQHQ